MDDASWLTRYRDKVVSPANAIRSILPGRRILIGSGAAEPTALVLALTTDGEHLADNELVHLLTLGPAPDVRPEFSARFRHVAFFIGANVRPPEPGREPAGTLGLPVSPDAFVARPG